MLFAWERATLPFAPAVSVHACDDVPSIISHASSIATSSIATSIAQARGEHPLRGWLRGKQGDVEQVIAAAAQRIMGFVPDAKQPLMEAGLDSLGAVELRNDLTSRLKMELPATLTLDYPSIAAVATFIKPLLQANTSAPAPASPSISTISDVLSVSFQLRQNLHTSIEICRDLQRVCAQILPQATLTSVCLKNFV